MSSPTQQTLGFFRDREIPIQVVERWNQHAGVRVDLFGVIDCVAISPKGICGVQTTAISSMSARRAKIRESETARKWLVAGGLLYLQGWQRRHFKKADGTRSKARRWVHRTEAIVLSDRSDPFSELDFVPIFR